MLRVYIRYRTDGQRGTGTSKDPFNGNNFDWAIAEIKRLHGYDAPVEIQIGNGVFMTIGFALAKNWTIHGSGTRRTILKLMDVGAKSFHHPDVYVISTAWYGGIDPAWAENFTLSDMTLDCDWENQSDRQTKYIKYAGVHALCTKGAVKRVRVINFGSNGVDGFHNEVFPITLGTYSDEGTYVTIQDCIVEKQHQYQGGYATAINVVTTQPNAGDRILWGTRKSCSALVKGNKAYGIYGHGFGCGHTENAIFKDNLAFDCKTGFNCDTGHNRNVLFQRNSFVHCVQGIHSGNEWGGSFSNFKMEDNDFHTTEKWLNVWLDPKAYEYSYGIRMGGNTKNFQIIRNSFKCLKVPQSLLMGSYGIGTASDSDDKFEVEDNSFDGFKDEIALKVPRILEYS